ncbi:PCDH15 [Lepeophtheirus salmonis]|uniref:PCDH15 n=1 Tax=Lepeophtheirus salmonis TaxID=72036 RepID=A0A7R8CXL3_LEPSM|nr:PCDH15 [Lepeophtheirus salmonis]CAF2961933.1 PCDH15 [Lepeophtheirus salmonis]
MDKTDSVGFYSQGSETIELDPCSILDGGSHLIIAINESLQQDFSQFSEPEELLISGEIGTEISLKITEDKSRLFKLDGKQIRLNGPLDRDAADLSSLSLKVTCESLSNGKRRTIPLVVRVLDLNDNPPLFKGTPYIISLPENTPLNSIVFSKLASMDADANINGQVEYTLGDNGDDSPFAIESPYQGLASDRALNTEDRFTSTTTLTIKVQDSDDLPPVFNHPEGYTAEVISGYPVSTLHISPEKIHAEDQDSLRTEVVYSLVDGIPINYDVYFGIDPNSGVISQRQVIDKAQYDRFEIMVRGTEKTGRHIDAKLTINVLAEDKSPPVLRSSSNNGYIDEGAEIGTYVTDINGNRIDFSITDDDIEDGVELQTLDSYDIELTTKYFQIDQEGYLIVNQSDIDRDPPFQPVLTFQIFAREKFDSFKSSSPVQLTISIRDINDNSPVFAPISDITLTAGTTRRIVTHFNATDKDSDKFIVYKLLSVSNNGRQKFFLNSKTGLLEVIAPIYDGEQYAITVEAKDNGGLSNIAVLRVNTRPMPNVQKPKFDRFLYDIKIREGVPKFTSVVETMAKDPENSPVLYSIISGNELEHFVMEESTGIVRAMSVLDREAHSSYNLTIRAQDNGGKFSTVALTITVLDENDNTPEFQNLPFSFRVTEGTLREFVGEVSAVDVDQSSNGKVFYYLNETEDTFSIEELTGRIYTLKSLDFEEQSVHYLVIGAKDNGSPALSATATATILVQDISDETPIFENPLYNISISENNEPELLLTTVQAIDKDSEPSITYRIITGDRKRFRVNQTTGDVYATHKFDYEKEFYYSLVIGTEEGFFDGELSGEAVTKVEIHIEDLNDVPPHFVKVPYGQTISIRNNVPIGQKIGSVQAEDSSGLTPIDTIGFNMSSDGSTKNADKYFGVDPVKGDILIVGNLTEDIIEEYQLEIVTYSIENPQLQSSILIRVVIKIVTSLYTGPGLGFEELEYEIDMEENAKNNLVISIRTNENQELQGIFVSRVNEKKECDLILNTDEIDRERNDRYEILVELQSRPEFINTDRNEVHIRVNIQDINDHSPLFEKKRYFGIVKKESLPNTPIVQVEATDRDSGSNGKILYSFQSMNNETEDLFQIDSESGIISNILELSESDVDLSKPFQLLVVAEDQSLDIKKRLVSNTNLIINVLDINANDLVLTLPKINPTEFESHRDDLINVLEDTTGYKVGIDRVDTAMIKYLNGTCCTAHYGTDVYFHVIDPIQYRILNSTENKVKTNILDSAPKLKEKSLGYLFLTTMAVIYLCCARRRIEMDLEKKEKMIVVPRYEPIFMDPPQKEYETQILQMNVPYATEDFKVLKSDSNNDDLDSNDFNMDDDMFFNLDNINYITKEDNNYN